MDDVISLIRIGLQSCLDGFKVYYQKWKVTVKNKKTEVMIVEKRQAPGQMQRCSLKRNLLKSESYIHIWELL